MALPPLPKNPKVTDLIPMLEQLDARAAALETRLGKTEATATGNKERLDALDDFRASHSAGAVRRQQEISHVHAENQRLRWAIAHGRKP